MTGYGKSEAILQAGKLTIEIRTLNSKNADINIKSFILPKDKELKIRSKIAASLTRGTIDVYINLESNAFESAKKINGELAKEYYEQIRRTAEQLGIDCGNGQEILSTILKMPDVLDNSRQELINDENWSVVENAFDECLAQVNKYREDEGKILYDDVISRVRSILEYSVEIEDREAERLSGVRERILKAAEDLGIKMDKERFEQEMIYYLEKMDINEERVRLRQHCKYFIDTIDNEEFPGKKLGFIIQEMGREINTTGSKANHALIQKNVVKMKDELEKIREQSMNIL